MNKWITKDQISALNAQEGKSPLRQIVASQEEAEEGAFLQSDVDEQIILHFPFGQTIKLHSLSLSIPEGTWRVEREKKYLSQFGILLLGLGYI